MIDKLKIGPVVYSVKLVGESEFRHLQFDADEMFSGESRPDECTMLINREHHVQQQLVALFHEITHIILLHGGKQFESADESLISVLAHGFLQVFTDNQALQGAVELLAAGWQGKRLEVGNAKQD